MPLTGRLDKVSVSDVLYLLSSNDKSGRLKLTQPGGEGVIVLRAGKIIYAASSSVRETLGSMLICRRLITQEELNQALAAQSESESEQRLGSILTEAGALSQQDLEQTVAEQIQRVLAEFLEWKTGYFRFDRLEVPDFGEVEMEAPDFLIDNGLPADQLLLDLAQQLADEEEELEGAADDGLRSVSPERLEEAGPLASLKSIMAEIRSPACTGEVTSQILDFAQGLVQRGVLFSAGPLGFAIVGQFGISSPGDDASSLLGATEIPPGEPSILREAIARKTVYVGRMEESAANRDLIRRLGGDWPDEVLVAPLIVSGRVVLIFYGDNLPNTEPVADPSGFDLVLIHAGLAIEKSLLEKRLEYAEKLRLER